MAGTIAVINEMQNKHTISHCWEIGTKLFNGWNKIVETHGIDAKMIGYPIRMTLKCFDSKNEESIILKSLILQEMIKRKIFISPGPSFISFSHTSDDIEHTLSKLDEACRFIKKNIQDDNFEKFLDGKPPKTIWSMDISSTKKPSSN